MADFSMGSRWVNLQSSHGSLCFLFWSSSKKSAKDFPPTLDPNSDSYQPKPSGKRNGQISIATSRHRSFGPLKGSKLEGKWGTSPYFRKIQVGVSWSVPRNSTRMNNYDTPAAFWEARHLARLHRWCWVPRHIPSCLGISASHSRISGKVGEIL